jgi:hypothetical protein
MSKSPTTIGQRQITLEIEANGSKIPSVIGTSPLRHLILKVSTTDGSGRQELLLNFDLDVTPRTGQGPRVNQPE